MPIIGDNYVDPEFGTGVLKITPAHDHNDYEIGKRHNLDFITIFNKDGTVNSVGGDTYEGLDWYGLYTISFIIEKRKHSVLFILKVLV